MLGSSVALGVIAGKCGSLCLVLVGPAGCLRGRWCSGLRKWRHDAGSRARGRKHRAPVGVLRLKLRPELLGEIGWQEAPRTCGRAETGRSRVGIPFQLSGAFVLRSVRVRVVEGELWSSSAVAG